ncbi:MULTISPECIES: ethanolamine utilization protein EutJ [unclassified Nocardioides]|uniref:ethanolamine utilization protein EutJ n=1 Tax=unclassified Nocardioides TaxID=2615069 RepID=UPI00005706BF|nr:MULTISPECIES: ethanolamine utilization protein EutJ [unclassified Nocardioides]ABL83525.1 ethanolamine utilization protein EutJ family protein [Nocardioides sp. JS614]
MDQTALRDTMAALEAAMVSTPLDRPPTLIKGGVDLGTAYLVMVALDADDRPLAAAYETADVVRDGVVTDFVGAIDVLRRLKAQVEDRLGVAVPGAHGAYPPGVDSGSVRAVRHVIESVGMECTGLVDEPSAANAVLRLRDGVVVDIGGGTTGVAVVQDGTVVHTADEPTGGTHLSLVISGALKVSFEEAERLKKDPVEQPRLFPVIRPVMEKVASIVSSSTRGWPTPKVYLVGGTAAFPGFADVVAAATGLDVVVPVAPLFVTPLGIARSAPALEAGGAAGYP